MAELRPGKYFIACELNTTHRVLDLPSQHAHQEGGLVQAITRNGSEYQKWQIELVKGEAELYRIRSNLISSRFIEPLRRRSAEERSQDGVLLAFYSRTESEYQQWRVEETETSGKFYIRNEGSGKYWDLREQDPSHIQQLYKKDIAHQRWVFESTS